MTQQELDDLKECLRNGERKKIVAIVEKLIKENTSPVAILNDGLIPGMTEVGEMMKCGEIYLPEVLHSAGAMNAAMDILKPLLLKDNVKPVGRIVMGTVKGDMHDIGKNLVGIMLKGSGMEVIDIGVQAPPDKFIEAIKTHSPAIVGMSAMLTTTMLGMKATIEAIRTAGLRESVKIMVGGAPVSQRFADEIGADAYARDAVRAAEKVKELLAAA
jgi:5-methyltetrahydrofolate--homocysteine methyltransferase